MIFAAGLGSRLKPFTDHHPKALALVNGKTLLEHNIRYLQQSGIYDVVVNVHHFADQIEGILAQNKGWGSNVIISDESNEVLETGGGLKKATPYFEHETTFVVMNVDILTNLNLAKMIAAQQQKNSLAMLAVMDRDSSRALLFDHNMQLCAWRNNSNGDMRIARQEPHTTAFAFSGIQILSGRFLSKITEEGKFSIIDTYLRLAATEVITGYNHSGDTLIDVGKPESLALAANLF